MACSKMVEMHAQMRTSSTFPSDTDKFGICMSAFSTKGRWKVAHLTGAGWPIAFKTEVETLLATFRASKRGDVRLGENTVVEQGVNAVPVVDLCDGATFAEDTSDESSIVLNAAQIVAVFTVKSVPFGPSDFRSAAALDSTFNMAAMVTAVSKNDREETVMIVRSGRRETFACKCADTWTKLDLTAEFPCVLLNVKVDLAKSDNTFFFASCSTVIELSMDILLSDGKPVAPFDMVVKDGEDRRFDCEIEKRLTGKRDTMEWFGKMPVGEMRVNEKGESFLAMYPASFLYPIGVLRKYAPRGRQGTNFAGNVVLTNIGNIPEQHMSLKQDIIPDNAAAILLERVYVSFPKPVDSKSPRCFMTTRPDTIVKVVKTKPTASNGTTTTAGLAAATVTPPSTPPRVAAPSEAATAAVAGIFSPAKRARSEEAA